MIRTLIKRYQRPLAEILLVAFLLCAAAEWCYSRGYNAASADWKQRWMQRDIEDAKAQAQREAEERTEEQRRQAAITRVKQNAEQQISDARADAARANDAGKRLQQSITELQRRLQSGEVSRDSGPAGTGAARGAGCGVLASVLTESVKRNQQLAEEADRRRIAGLACENAYDSLRTQ